MPNQVDTDGYSLTMLDFSGEKSTTRVSTLSLTDSADFALKSQAFEDAIVALTLGTKNAATASKQYRYSSVAPVDQQAQRETKLLVRYQDAVTGKNYGFTIGTVDLEALTMIAGSDEVDINDGGVAAALVSAIEDFVASPSGNNVLVTGMRHVGRNI